MNNFRELEEAFSLLLSDVYGSWPMAKEFNSFYGVAPHATFQLSSFLKEANGLAEVNEQLSAYENFQKHVDCLVGVEGSLIRHSEDSYILQFIVWNLVEDHEFNKQSFSRKFNNFVSFFEDDEIEIAKECRLFNFSSDESSVDFGEIQIESSFLNIDHPELLRLSGNDYFNVSNFVLLQKKKFKKKIKSSDVPSDSEEKEVKDSSYINFHSEVKENFDYLVKAIRLLGKSAFYIDNKITDRYSGFAKFLCGRSSSSFHPNTLFGEKFRLEKKQLSFLKKIWNDLKSGEDKRGKLSLNRLSDSIERRSTIDKVLDCFIGLESLYLPKENSELSFRLCLRISKMMETEGEKQQELFSYTRKMYKVRSKLAHGEKTSVSNEDIVKLEKLLRDSIELYYNDKEKFSDGSLDNILFH